MDNRKIHPTCHKVSLTTTTKAVAFFDMLFGLFGLIWFVLMLSRYDIITLDPFENIASANAHNETKNTNLDRLTSLPAGHAGTKPAFATNHKVISLTLVAFYTVVNLTVFAVLLVGVHKRSPGICLIWFNVRCAIFVFKAVIMIIYWLGGRPFYSQLPFIISMVVHLYGLWVVSRYVDELRMESYDKKVKVEQEVREAAENDNEMRNGIEELQQKRLKEGLDNPVFGHIRQDDIPEEKY